MKTKALLSMVITLICLVSPGALNLDAAENIGEVISIEGKVTAISADATPRELEVKSPIHLNDRIITGEKSKLQIMFKDDTVISQGEKAMITIDEYVYNPEKKDVSCSMDAAKGVFRLVTGKITKVNPEGFKVKTKMATIGIRGCEVGFRASDTRTDVYVIGLAGTEQIVVNVPASPGQRAREAVADKPGAIIVFDQEDGFSQREMTEEDQDNLFNEVTPEGADPTPEEQGDEREQRFKNKNDDKDGVEDGNAGSGDNKDKKDEGEPGEDDGTTDSGEDGGTTSDTGDGTTTGTGDDAGTTTGTGEGDGTVPDSGDESIAVDTGDGVDSTGTGGDDGMVVTGSGDDASITSDTGGDGSLIDTGATDGGITTDIFGGDSGMTTDTGTTTTDPIAPPPPPPDETVVVAEDPVVTTDVGSVAGDTTGTTTGDGTTAGDGTTTGDGTVTSVWVDQGGGADWNWGYWVVNGVPDSVVFSGNPVPVSEFDAIVAGTMQYNLAGFGEAGAIVRQGAYAALVTGTSDLSVQIGNNVTPSWNGTFNMQNVSGDSLYFTAAGLFQSGNILTGNPLSLSMLVNGGSYGHGSITSSSMSGGLLGTGTGANPITGISGQFNFDHGGAASSQGGFGADLN